MKKRIFNLIILDESGSMSRIQTQAIDGVNETIQSIRAAQKENTDQEHFVTLVIFNNDAKTLYKNMPVDEVKDITDQEYVPNKCTALFDAMGFSLTELKRCVAETDRVLVTVVTDGYENASKEFSGPNIKTMVEDLKKKGWVFTYIGANQDVAAVAANMSIDNYTSFETTAQDTTRVFTTERECRSRLYTIMSDDDFDAAKANKNFFDEK